MIRLQHLRIFRRQFDFLRSPNQYFLSTQRRKSKSSLKNSELLNYAKKSPIEHVLLRPGMYVGQTNIGNLKTWTINSHLKKMTYEIISISPALVKLFDETLVNASDNKLKDESMNEINIDVKTIEDNKLTISILNNGKGIPVAIHPEENIYIPSLVFGQLLTGSNFDDDKMSRTGGRHGYGAKLANIFSHWFEVETYDSTRRLHFLQRWENNMTSVQPPVVTPMSASPNKFTDYIKVTFQPELSRFEHFTSVPPAMSPTVDVDVASPASHSSTSSTSPSTTDQIDVIGQPHPPSAKALEDTIQLMRRRAYDVAGCLQGVTVTFNGEALPVKSFRDYFQLFADNNISSPGSSTTPSTGTTTDTNGSQQPLFFRTLNEYCDVGLLVSKTGNFECMSFVNSVWTSKGGTHVNIIKEQIVAAFQLALQDKKITHIRDSSISNKLFLFLRCEVKDAQFDSQSKDTLTNSPSSFGFSTQLPAEFLIEMVNNSGILEMIIAENISKENKLLNKSISTKGKKILVDKLEDAHEAGGKQAAECTLILTEGDSAKALAVAGLEIVGRDLYGVLPLQGKILNVRGATNKKVIDNKELSNLAKALGLNYKTEYTNTTPLSDQGLRYGHVLLMTDQDNDGSHIKGLIINYFHHFWPSLLQIEGFMQQFVTPLIKMIPTDNKLLNATTTDPDPVQTVPVTSPGKKKRKKKSDAIVSDTASLTNTGSGSSSGNGSSNTSGWFYSLQEYDHWRKLQDASSGGTGSAAAGTIKYYKGLGTSTAEEGKSYFRALAKHQKLFLCNGKEDAAIDMAFSKAKALNRREWMTNQFDPTSFIDPLESTLTYEDFVNKELIHFSHADIVRSLPSAIDGLKPSQRKVLYACFKRKLTKEIKVAQLAGYVSEHTAYHHGEASLHSTIVKMAQDFMGANNIPLLFPSGQFGTRSGGGSDFASARYIYTRLTPIARLLFPESDDALLDYQTEDGQVVEPKYYVPVIPLLLLNGSEGIGTGWSTKIPSYNIVDVIQMIEKRIKQTEDDASIDTSSQSLNSNASSSVTSSEIAGVASEEEGSVTGTTSATANQSTELTPWYRGFKGAITAASDSKSQFFVSCGVIQLLPPNAIEITELPIGVWTDSYKQKLMKIMASDSNYVKLQESHTTTSVCFRIIVKKEYFAELSAKKSLLVQFKLRKKISMQNMHAFDEFGKVKKFQTATDIFDAFFPLRQSLYVKRRELLIKKLGHQELIYRNRAKFVVAVVSGTLQLQKNKGGGAWLTSELEALLKKQLFDSITTLSEDESKSKSNDEENNNEDTNRNKNSGYSYLLSMPIQSLTSERATSLQMKAEALAKELEILKQKTWRDLWLSDLETIKKQFPMS